LSCVVRAVCCNANLDELQLAGSDCKRLSGETADLCTDALKKCESVINYGEDIQSTISGLTSLENANSSTFLKIKELVEESDGKLNEAKSLAMETDDITLKCVNKSKEMIDSMDRGVKNLPDPLREAIEAELENENEEEHQQERGLTGNVDRDIGELEKCVESLDKMNLYSAAISGSKAFCGLTNKWELCRSLFTKMKELTESISSITDTFIGGNYFTCVQALATGQTKEITRCIQLSKLVEKLADSAGRLVKAIINLIQVTVAKFKIIENKLNIGDDVGEKVQNFITGVTKNPGKFIGNFLSG